MRLHERRFTAALAAVFVLTTSTAALADMKLPRSPLGTPPVIKSYRVISTPRPIPRPVPVSVTRPSAPVPVAPPRSSGSVWDRLAQCESGGDWGTNTGNGYYGGIQFSAATWRAAGGTKYAPSAHLATREQQIAVAESWLAKTSWSQWPACSRRLGLR